MSVESVPQYAGGDSKRPGCCKGGRVGKDLLCGVLIALAVICAAVAIFLVVFYVVNGIIRNIFLPSRADNKINHCVLHTGTDESSKTPTASTDQQNANLDSSPLTGDRGKSLSFFLSLSKDVPSSRRGNKNLFAGHERERPTEGKVIPPSINFIYICLFSFCFCFFLSFSLDDYRNDRYVVMMTAVFSCCCSRSRVVPANPDGPFRSLEEEKKINSLLSTSHEWNDGAKDHLSLSSTSLPDVGIHEPELHVKGSLHFHIGADFPSSTPKLLAYLAKHEPFHLNWRGISFVDIVEAGTDRKQKLSLRCRSGSLSAF